MFTMYDVEEIVLGMAELVRENRYLRKKNEELSEKLRTSESRLENMYKSSQKSAANALVGALAMSYKESGDLEKAQYFASKIDLD
jgi:regulator of replication initiation timing